MQLEESPRLLTLILGELEVGWDPRHVLRPRKEVVSVLFFLLELWRHTRPATIIPRLPYHGMVKQRERHEAWIYGSEMILWRMLVQAWKTANASSGERNNYCCITPGERIIKTVPAALFPLLPAFLCCSSQASRGSWVCGQTAPDCTLLSTSEWGWIQLMLSEG